MTDTFTPTAEAYETASRVARFDDHPGLADAWQECADRVRAAESRERGDRALAALICIEAGASPARYGHDDCYLGAARLIRETAEWLIAEAVHLEQSRLAADGRLLPEDGTDDEDGDGEQDDTEWREEITRKWRDASEAARRSEHHFPADCLAEAVEMLNRGALTPPAVSAPATVAQDEKVADDKGPKLCTFCLLPPGHDGPHVVKRPAPTPDSGPDGTPEKPWPTWQDVPEGVEYAGIGDGGRLAYVNRGGVRYRVDDGLTSVANDLSMAAIAPFVRVDGGVQ